MGTQRLEAFTDGVMAIIITIMVLEIKTPHEATLAALLAEFGLLLTQHAREDIACRYGGEGFALIMPGSI
jgi:hypothetical protein